MCVVCVCVCVCGMCVCGVCVCGMCVCGMCVCVCGVRVCVRVRARAYRVLVLSAVGGIVHLLMIQCDIKGKLHPCTGTEALYRPYGL